jgi:hypothetical protein
MLLTGMCTLLALALAAPAIAEHTPEHVREQMEAGQGMFAPSFGMDASATATATPTASATPAATSTATATPTATAAATSSATATATTTASATATATAGLSELPATGGIPAALPLAALALIAAGGLLSISVLRRS